MNIGSGTQKLFWFVALLIVLPAWMYGLRSGRLVLALAGFPVFVLLIVLSFRKLRCTACGKVMRTVGAKFSHCPHCGTPYAHRG